MANKSKMICITGKKALHRLNESAGSGRYILEGVFAELDKLNRNSRIYTKEEYLKHLQYLRDDIRKGEPLLGELDHPEDRFEVKLKEASHRVIDIWYDQAKNVVMGKIELLNTPNGKLAQSIVDQGIPLHISSRAAGTVNSDNTVSIQQIYTYDLVCKPGFAGAVLHRVNESVGDGYTNDVMGFLKKSENVESANKASKYGFVNEGVSISNVDSDVNLRKEALDIIKENDKIRDIMKKNYKPINEADDDFADIFGGAAEDTDDKEKDTEKSEGGDEEEKDDDKKDDGVEILSITPEYASDSESEEKDDEKKEDEGGEEEDNSDEQPEGEGDENNEDSTDECDKDKKADPEKDAIFDDKEQTEDLKKEKEKIIDQLDELIDKVKKNAGKDDSEKQEECAGSKCESLVMAQYPLSRSLNESNFAQFAALSEEQKTKVTAYLQDRGIYAPKMINEMWKNGIDYCATEPVWLKYAPAKYKALYNDAPQMVKESLANTAEYVVFESQRDVNLFWENSGLETKAEVAKRNKAFTDNLPKINESAAAKSTNLPYGANLISAVAEMASMYN